MADVELVIKIPEEYYNFIKDVDESNYSVTTHLYKAVYEGTILPKGHGNLVDYEELKNNAREYSGYAEATLSYIKPKTIIEADRGEEK